MPWVWPDFKYESSLFHCFLEILIKEISYFDSFALIETIAEPSSS